MSIATVAVILSYYKGEMFIKEQLESIFSQNYVDYHLYIRSDGNPMDGGQKVIEEFIAEGKPITLIIGENVGVQASFYKLLEIACEHDYIAFCDQDDYWFAEKLSNAVNSIGVTNTPTLYCSAYQLVDHDLGKLDIPNAKVVPTFENGLFKNFCTGCTCVINRALREKLLSSYSNRDVPMHDWWALLVAYITGNVVYDKQPNIKYRQHSNNVVGGVDNFLSKLKRYISGFFSRNNTRNKLIRDLKSMSELDSSSNNQHYIELLDLLINSRGSLVAKTKCLARFKCTYNSMLDRISVYLCILFGRF